MPDETDYYLARARRIVATLTEGGAISGTLGSATTLERELARALADERAAIADGLERMEAGMGGDCRLCYAAIVALVREGRV
jgi:hypothetical protein